jgi:CDP-diacylglycerol--serine O-phosphatidyltransferase
MIGCYNYTVILTYVGTFFGFLGITYIWAGDLKAALICLMAAGFCDMFDGRVASTMERTKQEKRFGIQIDSLSDLICFGVLPSLIAFQCSSKSFIHIILSAGYLLCALIRLAWFNVDEEERQEHETSGRKVYLGLPVTTSAMLMPFFVSGAQLLGIPVAAVTPWLILCIAIAFITPFHLKKPGGVEKIIMMLCGFATLAMVIMG